VHSGKAATLAAFPWITSGTAKGTEIMEEKERQKLFGETLTDFVNAKNLNEAYFGLIENIQKALEFSPAFKEKIKAPLYDWQG
jgi:hypothetical protein